MLKPGKLILVIQTIYSQCLNSSRKAAARHVTPQRHSARHINYGVFGFFPLLALLSR